MCEQDKRIALQLIFSICNKEDGVKSILDHSTDIQREEIYSLLKKHDLTHILAYVLLNNSALDKNTEFGKKLTQDMMIAIYRYESIRFEQERIRECLKFTDIPFIFLKGSVIRQYYPEPWLRTSCDIDILVPIEKLSEVSKLIALKLDYRIDDKEAYDVSLFAENGMHLEIHTLAEGDSEERSFLKKVWDTAYSNGNSEYFMPDELFYCYHIAHMVKHFKNGGCGLRPFIDLAILQETYVYDRESVDSLLREFGLKQFESCALKLAKDWLNGISVEDLQSMEKYVLCGGVYGTLEQHVAARQGEKDDVPYLRKRIFVPYETLKKRYKVLEKHKWLTPAFEVIRWISWFEPKRMKRSVKEVKHLQNLDEQQVEEIADLFSFLEL